MQVDHKKTEKQVLRAQKGSGEAFAELYKIYFPGLYFFALRQLESEDRAFDVTQETFLYTLLHINDLRAPRAFHRWIYAVMASRISDARRRSAHEDEAFASLLQFDDDDDSRDVVDDDEEFLPESVLLKQENRDQIQRMMHNLTDVQREVVILHYFADFPTAAIADILGVQPAAVRKRLYDARAALSALLGSAEREAQPTTTQVPVAKPVLSQLFDDDFRQCGANAAQGRMATSLSMMLPLVLEGAKLNPLAPETSARVKSFARQVDKHPEALAETVGTKAPLPIAVKFALGLVAVLLLVGGGYMAYSYLGTGNNQGGGTPAPGDLAQAATMAPAAPATSTLTSDTPEATAVSKDATATPVSGAPSTTPSKPSDGQGNTGSAPTPAPVQPQPAAPVSPAPAPVITVLHPQITYTQGMTLTAADILSDSGATAHDAQGRSVPVTVTGLANINTGQTGIWKVFLHATDTNGVTAITKIITIRIVK